MFKGNSIGFIVMVAGIIGLISGYRKSYTLVYSFYTASLISMLISIFLIVYYSILIQYYYKFKSSLNPNAELFRPSRRPDSADVSFGIVATNLSLSIVAVLISFFAVIASVIAGKICIRQKTYSVYCGNQNN